MSSRNASPATRRVLLIGDSHIHAMQEALKARDPLSSGLRIEAQRLLKTKDRNGGTTEMPRSPLTRFFRSFSRGSHAEFTTLGDISFDQALRVAARLDPEDVLVSVFGGNQHAVFSTIQHAEPFDFMLPDAAVEAAAGETHTLIPFRTLFPYFRATLRDGDGETIAAFRRTTKARMVHLLAPPPKRMNDWIEQHHDTLFKAEGIASQGVSSPELRMKFWRLQNRAITDICHELGLAVLGVPEEARDEDGFLARPFYAGDATHANARYGELVLEQIETRFGRGVAAEAKAS